MTSNLAPPQNPAALLIQPDVDHAVPVLDGSVLRAALTVSKPGYAVTPADQRVMQDIAQDAALLLRGHAPNPLTSRDPRLARPPCPHPACRSRECSAEVCLCHADQYSSWSPAKGSVGTRRPNLPCS